MSIEFLTALNAERMPYPAALNAKAAEMGIPLEVGPSFSDLSRYGYRPARFGGRDSGIEAGLAGLDTIRGTYDDFDREVVGRYDSALTLTFGSDAREGAVAMAICAVLTEAAEAVTYSTEDGRFVGASELRSWMSELEAQAAKREMPQ